MDDSRSRLFIFFLTRRTFMDTSIRGEMRRHAAEVLFAKIPTDIEGLPSFYLSLHSRITSVHASISESCVSPKSNLTRNSATK